LRHFELNVNEIVKLLNMGQSRVSRHLKIMNDSGLLASRRDGIWVFYSAPKNSDVSGFIDSIGYLLSGDPVLDADLERAGDILNDRKKETSRFFDSVAEDWEIMKRTIIGERDLATDILKRIQSCTVVADLGCGTGDLLVHLQKKAKTVIGVDNSPKMLKRAQRYCEDNKMDTDLRIGELEHLPMRNAEADCVIINLVLHHLAVPLDGIREARRVLKKNGQLIVTDFDKHEDETLRGQYGDRWLGFAKEEVEKWMKSVNLRPKAFVQLKVKRGLSINLYVAHRN
ncbi:MAG: ArsR/SmtB family transcription factor, partial [Planctomycetota bacterium]